MTGPGDLFLIVAMIALPLLFGVVTVIGAIALYPKERDGQTRGPHKALAIVLGCCGALLLLAGLGIGACWGYVLISS